MSFIDVRGVEQWVNAFANAETRAEAELGMALEDVADLLSGEVRRRVRPVKRLNIQDVWRPRSVSGRKPISKRVHGQRAEVELRSYWASGRAAPVRGVLDSTGNAHMYERTELWINPRGARNDPSGTRIRMTFQEAPGLEDWARQGEQGNTWQFDRHAVRLPAEALGPLAMYPAIKQSGGRIQKRFEEVAQTFVSEADG